MFDRILDFLLSIFHEIFPVFVVAEYQEAVVLRGGKFNRVCKPGLHLKIPYLDDIFKQHTVLTTLTIPAQSLVTKDGKNVVVKSMVKYKISDIKIFALEVFDSIDAISDVTMGIVKHIVMNSSWEDCTDVEIDNSITKKLRSEMKKFGVSVEAVTLTDIAQMRTLRLINETVLNA
jgi:regulator of protease activity HflC (stomatin/prohibitin superfamily)